MVAVISSTGIKLMPTSEYKARKLLKKGRAIIYQYEPFTIQLIDRENGDTQPIEYKCDTGYQNIGISICSEKQEYVNLQIITLKDEVERHNDCRKYRRTRRNRKTRYRKPRFKNRHASKKKDWLAPSLQHKKEIHKYWFDKFYAVMPITQAVFEMGSFDTQVLLAIEKNEPLPVGMDYQHGKRYQSNTLRAAVFSRDNHTCAICGESISNNRVLCTHHIGYWYGDRTNRIGNLLTVCSKCHVPANHQPNGKLWGLKPDTIDFKGAAFMNTVRKQLFNELKETYPQVKFSITYGVLTKYSRTQLGIEKTHSNDAYVMGEFHPKKRAEFVLKTKKRRHNRVLEKFYDTKYIDNRDGGIKTGKELSSGRTKRGKYSTNLRRYRKQKVSKGRRSIRRKHYSMQPHDIVIYNGQKLTVVGIQNNGTYVKLSNKKVVKVTAVKMIKHSNGYY